MADYGQIPMQTAATATGGGTAMDLRNASAAMIQLMNTGSPVGTVTFEGSMDAPGGAATWFTVALRATTQTNATTLVTSTTAPGAFLVPPEYALAQIRANISAYTSGAFTINGTRRSD